MSKKNNFDYDYDYDLACLYFLGIEADVLTLHFTGFTHDQVVKHLLCNLIMCGPNSAVISRQTVSGVLILHCFGFKNLGP